MINLTGRATVQTQSAQLIVTLPIYKDKLFLKRAVEALEKITPRINPNFAVLIAEDGSNSTEDVNDLRTKYENLIYIQHDKKLGRGRALREAWHANQGDVYVYLDVDLATDLEKFDAYRNLIVNQESFDLITGSRYIAGSVTDRPRLRRLSSLFYNWLVRFLFRTGVHDHQCGFKSFSRKLVQVLFEEAKSDTWFWDTEVIVLARKFGFRILEIPIHWTEKKGQKTPLVRLSKDMLIHGSGIIRLLWKVYFHRSGLVTISPNVDL
jgi:glycosyltransferase involved in cell wall biosynthesis